jgi:hypothetical protein
MMNLNIVTRFNKTNANTFQVLRNEMMEAFVGVGTKLFWHIVYE